MRHNFKLHAIAIVSICAIVLLLYWLIGPKNGDETADLGDRYVRITTASWGLNCNTEITRLRSQSVKLNADGTAPPPLKLALRNNVMTGLSGVCNGKRTCSTPVTSDILGEDPLPSCFKQLDLGYRCFSIDRQWKMTVNQGDLLSIDCNEAADAKRKP